MHHLTTIITTVALILFFQVRAQQDVQNANAPKLLPMEKVENPKTPKKTGTENSITKTNAPTLNTIGKNAEEKPKTVPSNDKSNAPVLSNQQKILPPKKDN